MCAFPIGNLFSLNPSLRAQRQGTQNSLLTAQRGWCLGPLCPLPFALEMTLSVLHSVIQTYSQENEGRYAFMAACWALLSSQVRPLPVSKTTKTGLKWNTISLVIRGVTTSTLFQGPILTEIPESWPPPKLLF